MRILILILTVSIASCHIATCYGAVEPSEEQIEQALLSLKEGASDTSIHENLRIIDSAGVRAFPVLLKHIRDTEPAAESFAKDAYRMRYDLVQKVWKFMGIARCTIGDIAFDHIQGSIEGSWPKFYRHLYLLTRDNVELWLEQHPTSNLCELRLAAAREALDKAESSENSFHQEGIDFLRKHLEQVASECGPNTQGDR
jgi:hypothetical protein